MATIETPTPSVGNNDKQDEKASQPFDLEQETIANTAFRRVVRTGKQIQLVLMSLRKGQEIGREMHSDTDQFIRVEQGLALVELEEPGHPAQSYVLQDGESILIPAGTYHNVSNAIADEDDDGEDQDLKLYTLYAPPHHPVGTVLFQ